MAMPGMPAPPPPARRPRSWPRPRASRGRVRGRAQPAAAGPYRPAARRTRGAPERRSERSRRRTRTCRSRRGRGPRRSGPSGTRSSERARWHRADSPAPDEEFDDEPEIPEYLIAERNRGRGQGGRYGTRGRGGARGGRAAYQSAVARERYGRGSGGGRHQPLPGRQRAHLEEWWRRWRLRRRAASRAAWRTRRPSAGRGSAPRPGRVERGSARARGVAAGAARPEGSDGRRA